MGAQRRSAGGCAGTRVRPPQFTSAVGKVLDRSVQLHATSQGVDVRSDMDLCGTRFPGRRANGPKQGDREAAWASRTCSDAYIWCRVGVLNWCAEGKSDPLDAYAAADAVLSGRARAIPKLGTGIVEAIRALHPTRASAVKALTAAMNQLRSLPITAPAEVRDRLRGLAAGALVQACARLRPAGDTADPRVAVRIALRALARREHRRP